MTKVYIVMPCINLWAKFTRPAIDSVDAAMVAAKAHGVDTHFLLVDNASTDETFKDVMGRVSDLFTYQRNSERWGFQKSVNFGINLGFKEGYDIVLVLNNDVLLHPQSIWRLAERFAKGDAGMVTCMDVAGETEPHLLANLDPRDKEKVDEAPHPHFSAFAVDKDCWEAVGEFDEVFAPAYFEDNDFHHRMNLLDIPAVVFPPAMFFHFGSCTQNEANESGLQMVPSQQFENNRAYYVRKWGGVPGQEKYEHPYNDMLKPITFTKQTAA